MRTVITFVILSYFMYLIYTIMIYFKDDDFKKQCRSKIVYVPIPEITLKEFNLNNI